MKSSDSEESRQNYQHHQHLFASNPNDISPLFLNGGIIGKVECCFSTDTDSSANVDAIIEKSNHDQTCSWWDFSSKRSLTDLDSFGTHDKGEGNSAKRAKSNECNRLVPECTKINGVLQPILQTIMAEERSRRQASPPSQIDSNLKILMHCQLSNGGCIRISICNEKCWPSEIKKNGAAKPDEIDSLESGKDGLNRTGTITKPSFILQLQADELAKSQLPLPTKCNKPRNAGCATLMFPSSSLPFTFSTSISKASGGCISKLESVFAQATTIHSRVSVSGINSKVQSALENSGYKKVQLQSTNRSYDNICLPRIDTAAYYLENKTFVSALRKDMAAQHSMLHDLCGWVGAVSCGLVGCLAGNKPDDDLYASEYSIPAHLSFEREKSLRVIAREGGLVSTVLVERFVQMAKDMVQSGNVPFVAITTWSPCHSDETIPSVCRGATAVITSESVDTVLPSTGIWS